MRRSGIQHIVKPFATDNNSMWLCNTDENMSWRFSRNSEAFASEFLENIEEMFPRYL